MGKRFVSIWFPFLATDWFTLRKPGLSQIPFVLTAPVQGRMVVKAMNALAKENDIHEEMTLADAKAILPSLQHFDEKPGLVAQLLQRIAEWCIRFTPVAAPDGADGIFLDASGCTQLWGGEEAYLTDILNRLKQRGYPARAGIADTIGAAWAMARYGAHCIAAPGSKFDPISSFPPEALRIDGETCAWLHKLGLSKIQDLMQLQRTALRRRFGAPLLKRLDQLTGRAEESLVPVYPQKTFQERLPCFEPILRLEGIEIALQKLLDALCTRLRTESKGLRSVYFRGYRTDNKTTGIQVDTSRATCNLQHLYHLFQMKLSAMEPEPGIELFVLEATSVEDYTPLQEAFWKDRNGIGDGKLSEFIDRLEGKMGHGVVHRYLPDEHYWPERSFRKASSLEEERTIDWRTDRPRPLQVLRVPEAIEVTAPIPDYPPMLFRFRGQLHKIVRADGPERIEREWWIEEGLHRDYYAVEDESGCRYWLFRLGHYDAEKGGQWFLHGFFS